MTLVLIDIVPRVGDLEASPRKASNIQHTPDFFAPPPIPGLDMTSIEQQKILQDMLNAHGTHNQL